jgi:hypothetical protein
MHSSNNPLGIVEDARSTASLLPLLLLLLLLLVMAVLSGTCALLLAVAVAAPIELALPGCCTLIPLCAEADAGWLITAALPAVTLSAALNKFPIS